MFPGKPPGPGTAPGKPRATPDTLTTRFWRWFLRDATIRRVVRVKSLWPSWDSRFHAVAWPCLLVDSESGIRQTIVPIWTRERFGFRGRDAAG